MKSLGYLGAFLGGAIAGAALGILVAPEKGQDTRVKITDAVEDFLKKHNIKLSRKEVGDLIDDIQDAAEEENGAAAGDPLGPAGRRGARFQRRSAAGHPGNDPETAGRVQNGVQPVRVRG